LETASVRLFKERLVIDQAIYGSHGPGGYQFLARSPGFRDVWLSEAERLCTGFGERPAGVTCPGCVFARPFVGGRVAVVQAADQGTDDAGRPGALGFHLLIVPRRLYEDLGGDPFLIAERFPPPWPARGELPTLEWTGEPPAPRTLEATREVLDVPNSATLLGSVQALLDGGRVVFERTTPDSHLLRSLWALLPTSSRADLWPASFAFSNQHGFHAVAVPRANGPDFAHYLTEESAGDYPEGRYEFALQYAVEAGDDHELQTLFARRSRRQTFRLGLVLLALFILVPVGVPLLVPGPPPPGAAASPEKLDLPRADECPEPDRAERERLAGRIAELGHRLGLDLPHGSDSKELANSLQALDTRLGTPNPARDPGPLAGYGPLQRQLRALLWKHGVVGYNERGLNLCELLDKLAAKVNN
jgi:hypothetical protein